MTIIMKTVGIVIPTFQAEKHLLYCLPPLLNSPLKPKILLIDSSSTDSTVSLAKTFGVDVHVIPQSAFNHGTTRELGRKMIDTDIVVMITQDAYATSSDMVGNLIQPLLDGKSSIAYARQLPHRDASLLATFARHYNYPAQSHIRSLSDRDRWGSYTFFCSNSCAAYLNSALDEVGGFPRVLFGEDAVVTAKLLQCGHRIAYVAEAQVQHSHDYTLKQEFRRHFDMGLSRREHRDLLQVAGADTTRGKAYSKELMKQLFHLQPRLIPLALAQLLFKYAGYRAGNLAWHLPDRVNARLSSQKNYWIKGI